ncbi:MAG TPA: VOC family protein [Burkholderiaceae bacterium]
MLKPNNKVTPFLWFDTQAGEAADFYASVFQGARALDTARWGPGSPYPEGAVMSVTFELAGQEYIFFNGGSHFKLNEALSLFVSCEDQAEVDKYWDALTADGGQASQCGWLKDKFGVSWQIVPKAMMRLMADSDRARSGRAMQAMMTMTKLDVAALEKAANG